jgi:hypothetical protein
VAEDGVQQDETGYTLGISDGVEDGVGSRGVVAGQNRGGYAEGVEHGGDLRSVFFGREADSVGSIGPPVPEEVEGGFLSVR